MTAQPSNRKLLLVVDGNALVHRAWHALPPLTSPAGEVVSGVYGFMSILLRAIKELSPTHVVVTFDLAGPTFRHHEYEDYKANREKKPDELYEQIPRIQRVLDAGNIPYFGVSGFEADDVIGTITRIAPAEDRDLDCIIVTGDMDTLQLVDDRVRVLTLRKGMSDTVIYDPAGVEAKYGLTPDQMIDYKALRGDTSDNIPGVRGIGEKTATELLQKFGTLEALLKAVENGIGDIKPAVRKKLEAGIEDALKAQNLCRIRRDVDFDFSLEATKLDPLTRKELGPIFEEYGFMSLLKQLPAEEVAGVYETEEAPKPDAVTAESSSDIDSLVSKSVGGARISMRSIWNDGGEHFRPDVKAVAFSDGAAVWVMTPDEVRGSKEKISKILSDAAELVCHDLKRELHAVHSLGLEISCNVFDTMLASYLLDPGTRTHSLNHLLARRRGIVPPEKDAEEEESADRLSLEAANLVDVTDELKDELKDADLLNVYERLELPTAAVLARMEEFGVCLDTDHLEGLAERIGKEVRELRRKIHEVAGSDFNVNSPVQLQAVLFDELGLPTDGIKKTGKTGGYSTAASELEKLRGEHEIIEYILDYRELSKLKSTYIDALPKLVSEKDGRLHAKFNQAVTATGRLSSSDPNLQNIPSSGTEHGKEVRDAFCVKEGHSLLAADYSQIELRITAHLTGEPTMIDAFNNGEDIHLRTSIAMFGEKHAKEKRRIAKVINFGILYGMGPQMLSESAGISFAEARDYIRQYFELHPKVKEYTEEMRKMAAGDGMTETIYGRKRFFRNYHLLDRREKSEAERQAVNMPVQGSSADMVKDAMARIDRILIERFGDDARMIIQVHDELVFEIKDEVFEEAAEIVKKEMEGVVKLKVPVTVNMARGKKWGDMKEFGG